MDAGDEMESQSNFLRKSVLALLMLFLGMVVVIGCVWLLNEFVGLGISPGVRNVIAVAFGVFLANRVVGKDLQKQFDIQRAKNGQRSGKS